VLHNALHIKHLIVFFYLKNLVFTSQHSVTKVRANNKTFLKFQIVQYLNAGSI